MLRNRAIEQVTVQWKHFGPDEAIWEMEDQMRDMYPSLFYGLENVFGIFFGVMFLAYILMYMNVNVAMGYVIKLQ